MNNNIIENAKQAVIKSNRAAKEAELQNIAATSQLEIATGKSQTTANVTTDIVQPWLCDTYSIRDWAYHFQVLKNAGISEIIIQWSAELKDSKIKYLGYDSSLVNDPNNLHSEFNSGTYSYSKNMLKNMFEAAKSTGIKVYVGLCLGNDWWNNSFTNESWRINNCNLTNQIANEIYTKYKSSYPDTFIGWYYPWEMYTTPKNYETYWTDMLNRNLDYLTSINSNMPVIFSPYISTVENASVERAKEEFSYLAKNTHFRKGDILCLQDSLGTSTYSADKVIEYIKAIKLATQENSNLSFGLDVENYWGNELGGGSASVNRFISQLQISSLYASKIICFSYMHYYDVINLNNNNEYNKSYSTYVNPNNLKSNNTSTITPYIDKDKKIVPIPKGFNISDKDNEKTVSSGLVIKDSEGNEFVWVPVDGTNIEYKKYFNSNTTDDSLPSGVESESTQISKYGGFYIARYESAFDYNNGDVRVASIPSSNSVTGTNWQDTRTQDYDNYLWNHVKYSEAKFYSEQMNKKYNYDSSISTGLVTGTQWDSVIYWLGINGNNAYDSVSWGNYNNSTSPANTGNYQQSVLKPSGSNENWKAKNIYDLAGNLREWSSELDSADNNKKYFRSSGYDGNGTWGPAAYRESTEYSEFYYDNIGFRVVLYIK
jgi:hypothetical protein